MDTWHIMAVQPWGYDCCDLCWEKPSWVLSNQLSFYSFYISRCHMNHLQTRDPIQNSEISENPGICMDLFPFYCHQVALVSTWEVFAPISPIWITTSSLPTSSRSFWHSVCIVPSVSDQRSQKPSRKQVSKNDSCHCLGGDDFFRVSFFFLKNWQR